MTILRAPDDAPCVFIGGTLGFAAMADPANTARTRATGRAALYMHYNAIFDAAHAGTLTAIAAAWHGTGAGVAEFGTFDPSFFAPGHEFDSYFTPYGLVVQDCNINVDAGYFNPRLTPAPTDSAALLATFKLTVDAAKARGIKTCAPFVNPNTDTDLALPWTDPQWDLTRQACLYGGAIALDIPCSYFFGQSRATVLERLQYQQFCLSQVRWGLANNLRVCISASPYLEGANLLVIARMLYGYFIAAGASPTEWVVQNYDLSARNPDGSLTQSGASPIAGETTPGSTTETGLWYAEFANVAGTRKRAGDLVGQSSYALGPVTFSGNVAAISGFGLFSNIGLTVAWNYTPGRGEVAFLCGPQGGRGGATFYALDVNGGVVGPMLDIAPDGTLTLGARTIQFGSPDSGGTGFRALRTPN